MAPTIGRVALDNGFHGSIPGDWVAPPPQNIHCEAVTALCALIDELLKDIQHLELECIGTRYLLSQHMEEEQGSLLRSDILENLGRRHYGSPAYQMFKELQYNGGDPMEFRDYLVKVQKACKGEWPCWH